MSRRYFGLLMVLLVLSLTLLSGCTNKSEGLVPNSIEAWFKLVFVDLPNKSVNDPQYVFTMKALFTLLAFSVLFGASQLVLKNYAKNVRLAICFLLALISTLMIPGELLSTVAKSYGVVFAAVMIGAPVIGAVYLMFGVLDQPNRTHWAAKFGICVLMWYILGTFANQNLQIATHTTTIGIPGGGGSVVVQRTTEVIGAFAGGLSWLFLIGAIVYAVKFIMGEEKDEELPEEAKNAMKAVGRWFRTRRVGNVFEAAPKVLNEIEAAILAKDKPKVLDGLKKETKMMQDFREATLRAQHGLSGVTDADARTALQGHITNIVAAQRTIMDRLSQIKTYMSLRNVTPGSWNDAKDIIAEAQDALRVGISEMTEFVDKL